MGATTGTTAGSRWGLRAKTWAAGCMPCSNWNRASTAAMAARCRKISLFGREATIGLGSAEWGEFASDANTTWARAISGMLGSSFGGGFNQLNTGAGLGFSSSYPRYDNLLVYETPSMGGLRAAIGYSSNINDLKDSQTGFATGQHPGDHRRPALRQRTGQRLRHLRPAQRVQQAEPGRDQRHAALLRDRRIVRLRGVQAGAGLQPRHRRLVRRQELPNGGSVGAFTGTPSYAFSKGFRSNSYFIGLSAPLRRQQPVRVMATRRCQQQEADGRRLAPAPQPGLQPIACQAHRCLRNRIAHQQLGLRGWHQATEGGLRHRFNRTARSTR